MLTKFGKALLKLRVDNRENLKAMAFRLGMAESQLGAIARGARPIPLRWTDRIAAAYGLQGEDRAELERAAIESIDTIRLGMGSLTHGQRKVAFMVARTLAGMDDGTARRIYDILDDIQ
jgi:hypothetical protein